MRGWLWWVGWRDKWLCFVSALEVQSDNIPAPIQNKLVRKDSTMWVHYRIAREVKTGKFSYTSIDIHVKTGMKPASTNKGKAMLFILPFNK